MRDTSPHRGGGVPQTTVLYVHLCQGRDTVENRGVFLHRNILRGMHSVHCMPAVDSKYAIPFIFDHRFKPYIMKLTAIFICESFSVKFLLTP